MTTDLSDREKLILNLLIEQGTVTVVELSKQLSVSEVTIRSDLRNLEDRGLLNRIHGGAVPSIHPNIVERQNLLVETKQRIAKAAADLVQDGDTIMIEAGTTTAMLADKYDSDPQFATKLVILSTLCSIPAICLWSLILG